MENGENKEKMGEGGLEEEGHVQAAKPSANTPLPAHTDSHTQMLMLVFFSLKLLIMLKSLVSWLIVIFQPP